MEHWVSHSMLLRWIGFCRLAWEDLIPSLVMVDGKWSSKWRWTSWIVPTVRRCLGYGCQESLTWLCACHVKTRKSIFIMADKWPLNFTMGSPKPARWMTMENMWNIWNQGQEAEYNTSLSWWLMFSAKEGECYSLEVLMSLDAHLNDRGNIDGHTSSIRVETTVPSEKDKKSIQNLLGVGLYQVSTSLQEL